jgi:hypothetical protein
VAIPLCDSLDDQQLYHGTQSALSTTLLLWNSSTDGSATELIGKERSGNAELALLLVAPGKRAPIPQCSHASVATERGVVDLGP